jgi:hypothetical protein
MDLGWPQPLLQMSDGNLPEGKGPRRVRLTSSPSESRLPTKCEPLRLTALWAITGFYRVSFTWGHVATDGLSVSQSICLLHYFLNIGTSFYFSILGLGIVHSSVLLWVFCVMELGTVYSSVLLWVFCVMELGTVYSSVLLWVFCAMELGILNSSVLLYHT